MAIPLELAQVAKTLTYTSLGGAKVGIGTTVEINGGIKFSGGLYDQYNNVGTASSVLISTGVGVSWTAPFAAGLQGTQGLQGNLGLQGRQGTQGLQGRQGTQGITGPVAGTDGQVIYNNGGVAGGASGLNYDDINVRVGIGTSSPQFLADVAGDLRITQSNRMRFGGTSGTTNFFIQFNSTTNSLDFVAG